MTKRGASRQAAVAACHLGRMPNYAYSSLKWAIEDKSSPLREYLDSRFGEIGHLQSRFRESTGDQVVPSAVVGSGVNPGTVGTAFHLVAGLALQPDHASDLARRAFAHDPDEHRIVPLVDQANALVSGSVNRTQPLSEEAARACWALALCEEAFRTGEVWPGGVLDDFLDTEDDLTLDGLLQLAPVGGVDQLVQLHALACERLYAQLPTHPKQLELGPTFEASKWCSADADVICDGLLLEIKTTSGRLRPPGTTRRDGLSRKHAYQLLGYLLFDTHDHYRIRELGWYSARFGNLVSFSVDEFLSGLSDRPVDLSHERVMIQSVLTHRARSARTNTAVP